MKKSLVVGVHNGYNLLPYTIPPLLSCPVDEVIIVIDNCPEQFLYRNAIFWMLHGHKWLLKLFVKDWNRWRYRPCETFQNGLSHASGDLLFVSAEDVILDPANFSEKHWCDSNVGMVDFRYYQCDPFKWNFHVEWDTLLLKFSDKFGYGTARSGIYGVRKTVFDQVGGLKDSPTEEDWLRKDVVAAGYRHVHVKNARNLHLRPSYDRARQLMQGESRRKQGFSFARTLAHSILHLKPWVLKGYLKEGQKE